MTDLRDIFDENAALISVAVAQLDSARYRLVQAEAELEGALADVHWRAPAAVSAAARAADVARETSAIGDAVDSLAQQIEAQVWRAAAGVGAP